MMIPADIRALCEARPGHIYQADNSAATSCLATLGIDPATEFHAFFSTFVIANMYPTHSRDTLAPVADSAGDPQPGIAFAWEVWGIPDRFVAMTSLEGEGGYFYDKATGNIVDFELAHRADFVAGDRRILGETVFDFLRWYLGDDAEPRGYAAP
ncbi:MAG: hypothetical protein JWN66_4198 [Sphingomonas bacterium]|uniref:hypothetical protein n=1 Tax=Sphingomonas bacterium TaxID=1895847 RepID=UPI002638CB57|nr:hypothetical protein [Sphingomonas bacterium]MDB5707082.1 hypothetical protein [Sphingomonas bacterium]